MSTPTAVTTRNCRICGTSFEQPRRRGRPRELCARCGDRRAYYEQNKAEIAAKQRAYYEQNKAEIAAKQRREEIRQIITEARELGVDARTRNGHLIIAGERIDSTADWRLLRTDLQARQPARAA